MIFEDIKNFRDKLGTDVVLGIFSKTSDASFVEIAGYAGLDFIILDLEHGPNTVQEVQNLIRAAQTSKILPVVRTKENNYNNISEVLDIGAGAVQVPQVTSVEDAQKVIEHAKYAPSGNRGVCRFVRAAKFSSMDRFEYFKQSDNTIIIAQLEGKEALNNLEEIISVSGIDVIFIGPYDLSQSLGIPGQVDDPLVVEKMLDIVNVCKDKGVTVGTFVDTIENAKKWIDAGVKYLAYSVDVGIYYDALKKTKDDVFK